MQNYESTRIYKYMKDKIIEKELSYKLGGIFFEIQNELGRFCRERQYADLLEKKLIEKKLNFKREYPLEIADRKSNFVDFIIENKILIDLKAKPFIEKDDFFQMKRYLKIANLKLGLIVNFQDRYLKPKRVLNNDLELKEETFVDSDKFARLQRYAKHCGQVVSHRSGGFTMVEVIIGMSLFITVISASTTVFINAMRTQRAIVALLAVQSNISLAIEQIAREVRTGESFSLDGEGLSFTNAKDQKVIYRKNGDFIEKVVDGAAGRMTADNVVVGKLKFILKGNLPTDGRPPQVTILMSFSPKNSIMKDVTADIQTTISSRVLDG